jgi:hypothetical protein
VDSILFKLLDRMADLGGISLCVFHLLFREFIRKNISPMSRAIHAYRLILIFALLSPYPIA